MKLYEVFEDGNGELLVFYKVKDGIRYPTLFIDCSRATKFYIEDKQLYMTIDGEDKVTDLKQDVDENVKFTFIDKNEKKEIMNSMLKQVKKDK